MAEAYDASVSSVQLLKRLDEHPSAPFDAS
jgi:hypothetical protein